MDSSKVKKEIKEENIELFDVPIKNETKSNFKLKVKKERKDNLGLQIGLDIIDRLVLPVKNEVQDDFNPNTEVKKETQAPKRDLTDDIIIENYLCSLCQFSCGSQKAWDLHLNANQHKMKMSKKASKEKKQENANGNEFPKGATMFMKVRKIRGFKNNIKLKKEDIKNALMETFGIEDKDLASIENGNYESKSCGYVIFCKENAANELLEKIKGRSEMFKIKGADIKCRIVEGQEENAWHEHLAKRKFKKKA